jgi:predicted ATP-dependent serine protease
MMIVSRATYEAERAEQKRRATAPLMSRSRIQTLQHCDDETDEDDNEPDGEYVGPQSIMDVEDVPLDRISTGHEAIDAVTGGGFVRGMLYALHGPEGCGKSRIALLITAHTCRTGKVIYATATDEELARDVRRHVREAGFLKWPYVKSRLDVIDHADDTEKVVADLMKASPVLTIVDSASVLSSLTCPRVDQAAHAARELRKFARATNSVVIALFHLNNEGMMAGGSKIRHNVDAILQMEPMHQLGDKFVVKTDTEPTEFVRFRSGKNRFAPPKTVALFKFTDTGLKLVKR